MKYRTIIILNVFLALSSCYSEQVPLALKSNGVIDIENEKVRGSILMPKSNKAIKNQTGILGYIDSMRANNYRLDTNRLHKVMAWHVAASSPKIIEFDNPVILLDYPVALYKDHLTKPATYFFAKWNDKDSSFKNGNDYLLMSWEIDSVGIKNELKIYESLTHFMGNFPCFCFRDGNRIYALGHRMTSSAGYTLNETKRLRDYINRGSSIYGYWNLRIIDE